jgi:hypothetical protein
MHGELTGHRVSLITCPNVIHPATERKKQIICNTNTLPDTEMGLKWRSHVGSYMLGLM